MTLTYAVPKWVVISSIVAIFSSLFSVVYFMFMLWKEKKSDKTIIIDKSNNWKLFSDKTIGKKKIKLDGLFYRLDADNGGGLLNRKGKILNIFSWDNPLPMKIKYNTAANYLTSESLEAAIQNEVVQKIVRPVDPVKEMLIVLGAVGGMISGISSVIILLIVTGVIKGGVV